jgi:hypothetical protein
MNFHLNLSEQSASSIEDHYWNGFYEKIKNQQINCMPPSQFAAFCCAELKNKKIGNLVEIAAGDGRDTLFFANHGFNINASEKSDAAVRLLYQRLSDFSNVIISKIDAVKEDLIPEFNNNSCCAFYARFFIHVLNKNDLTKFFSKLASSMKPGDYFVTEYRNEKDETLKKVTPEHFREFHKSTSVSSLAQTFGMRCLYEVEGRGYAKWREDDAFVTRQIFEMEST